MKSIKKILFYNTKRLWKPERVNYRREVSVPVTDDPGFIKEFYNDLTTGIEWCNRTTQHWANIKVFEFSKVVITFNFGILAFGATAQGLFTNRTLFFASVIMSCLSLSLLTLYIWVTVDKNINNINDRGWILRDTWQGLNKNPKVALENYNTGLSKSFSELREHEQVWMALQKVALYLFMSAIVAALLGIVM